MRKLLWLLVVLASIARGQTTLAKARHRQAEAAPSFIAFHTARVQHDLMVFHPDYPGLVMKLRLLFRDTNRQTSSTALGLGLFAVTTVMSAHLPDPLRVMFDGPMHLGPAIFDDGGMGAGIAGTGP
jgi:hypothetical protein